MINAFVQPDLSDLPYRIYLNDSMQFNLKDTMFTSDQFVSNFIKRAEEHIAQEREQFTKWRITDILFVITCITIVMIVTFMFYYITNKKMYNEIGYYRGIRRLQEFMLDNMEENKKNKYVATFECETGQNERGIISIKYYFRFEKIEKNTGIMDINAKP